MARTARGEQAGLTRAPQALARATGQLRQAQAAVLPPDYGLSQQQTAQAIGQPVSWAYRLRNHFLNGQVAGNGRRPHAEGAAINT